MLLPTILSMTVVWRHKIAVVDDEKELATLYAEALDASGYNVASFSDPIAALVEVSKDHSQYALVISDNRMPGLNGIELLSQIRERDDRIQFIPIYKSLSRFHCCLIG